MIFNELKMADGDDRDENSPGQNQHNNGAPDLENLQIEEIEEPDNLEAEYLALDGQLNQLDACLDSLEARNDDLVLKLKAFLQANQQPAESQEAVEDDGGADGGSSLGGPSTSSSSNDSSKTDGAQANSNCETNSSGTSS